MKKIVIITLVIGLMIALTIMGLTYFYKDEIYIYYRDNVKKVQENITIDKNEYYNENDYSYFKNTDNFVAENKEELINIIYTIANSGSKSFDFYCSSSYENCINDVISISNDKDTLAYIDNFVHPLNQFSKINILYNKYNEITVNITRTYTDDEINYINNEVDRIIKDKIKENMSDKEKIKVIHNYIIDNNKYATDKIRNDNPNATYSKASYMLQNHYGICSSYSDLMSVFLYRFNINNIRISSKTHIWNLVYLDNKWYHLDLTWDDPIMSDGSDRLETLFFLISSKRLKELNVGEHNYSVDVFKEAK
jgi:hypothetical protein